MKVLITGAAGFIGSSLADALIEDGHDVWGVDNLSTGNRKNFPGEQFIENDIRTWVPRGKWDVIYHCAASYKDRGAWERDASTNVLGTLKVIREAQEAGAKIVYFQTSLCYGPNPASPVTLEAPLNPRGSYAVSKTAAETYIWDSGVPFVSLRLANIYGPRNLSGPIPAFYQRLSKDEPCTVVDSRRDFVFIDDLVQIALKAAINGSGIYHVASGSDQSIEEIYRAVTRAMGGPAPEPIRMDRGPDDVATILLDPSETYDQFGWTASTPLVAGIKAAVDWYNAHGVMETFTHLAQKG